ncbi:hypothetical protein L6452_17383 [Arctium lappa]|uniref:Uncharacterized protein n=1 Tax=Arctium lappa TaxID=4217 RepID=A0ACB9C393_ARCLA|nr:hypothetical protein L6452_17383 [Arctium lappa]
MTGVGLGHGFTANGVEDEIRTFRLELEFVCMRRKWELEDEIMEEIKRSDGSEPPIEFGHDTKLHSLNRFWFEYETGLRDLEIQKQRWTEWRRWSGSGDQRCSAAISESMMAYWNSGD